MKICFITNDYPASINEPIVSGEFKNPFYLSQTLKKLGHDVTVITTNRYKDFGPCRKSLNGVKIYYVKKFGGRYLKIGLLRPIIESINTAKKLLQLIKVENFDVIHIHTSLGISSAAVLFLKKIKIIKIPIIMTFHGTAFIESSTEIHNILFYNFIIYLNNLSQLYIDRIILRWSERIVSAGGYQVKEMSDVYRLPIEKIVPISNGVDTSFYEPFFKDSSKINKIRGKYGLKDNKIVLLVGRIARKKGFQYVVDAAPYILKQIPNTIFFIVGGTALFAHYEPKLIKKIKYLNLEKKFIIVKDTPEKDMPLYYNLADVCVVPSIDYEPLPTVVFEAMACGKPIVASNIGGIPDQIGYKYTLVPQKDPKEIAEKVIRILTDKDLANSLSNRNVIQSKNFDLVEIAKKHMFLYYQVIKEYIKD